MSLYHFILKYINGLSGQEISSLFVYFPPSNEKSFVYHFLLKNQIVFRILLFKKNFYLFIFVLLGLANKNKQRFTRTFLCLFFFFVIEKCASPQKFTSHGNFLYISYPALLRGGKRILWTNHFNAVICDGFFYLVVVAVCLAHNCRAF